MNYKTSPTSSLSGQLQLEINNLATRYLYTSDDDIEAVVATCWIREKSEEFFSDRTKKLVTFLREIC